MDERETGGGDAEGFDACAGGGGDVPAPFEDAGADGLEMPAEVDFSASMPNPYVGRVPRRAAGHAGGGMEG